MSDAWERAVEAGARAFMSVFKDPVADPSDYHGEVRATLRAAFPILAEELVKGVEDDLRHMDSYILDLALNTFRARIEQMKEKS